jgi:methanogenic corrinoid protein MtbC1
MREDLAADIADLKRDSALAAVKTRAEGGENPMAILDECRNGMSLVGERFQTGDYFLAELMLSAEIFKKAAAILEPYIMKAQPPDPIGKVLLATLEGDIHDLGKNIFSILLKSKGFEVIDLGTDVPPALVLEKVRETNPHFVGFSVLITSAFDSMKQIANMLEEAGLRGQFKLMVGGGVTTPAVGEYIGADFQTRDAIEGLDYCISNVKGVCND